MVDWTADAGTLLQGRLIRPQRCQANDLRNVLKRCPSILWTFSQPTLSPVLDRFTSLGGVVNRHSNQIGNGNRCRLAFHRTNAPDVIVRAKSRGQFVQLLDAVGSQTRDKTLEQRDHRHQRNQVCPEQP